MEWKPKAKEIPSCSLPVLQPLQPIPDIVGTPLAKDIAGLLLVDSLLPTPDP